VRVWLDSELVEVQCRCARFKAHLTLHTDTRWLCCGNAKETHHILL
jgi:hypothetical protein